MADLDFKPIGVSTVASVISSMPEYVDLTGIESETDIYLFDMHGVIHSGGSVPKEILDYLIELKRKDKKVIIASNDVRSGDAYVQAIAKDKGLIKGVHFDQAFTSGDVFSAMLESGEMEKQVRQARLDQKFDIGKRKIKVFVIDELSDPLIFKGENAAKFERTEDSEEADVILTGSPRGSNGRIDVKEKSTFLSEERKRVLEIVKRKKLPVIVPNPDTKTPFDTRTPSFQTVGAGRFGKLCSKLGTAVIMTGKPSKNFYDFLKFKLELQKEDKVVMIGDSFATDIIGGNDAGFITVAVVDSKRSNMGFTLKKDMFRDRRGFEKRFLDERTRPDVIVSKVK